MMIDLAETTTDRIHEAIRQARQRLGGPASGMVLTLVIVTDEAAQYDAVRSASEAAREHPMRVLAVITRRPEAGSRLDAEIRVGESGPGEVVLLRMYGALGEHADSVVTPLLMPDTPVVTWWPGTPPDVPFRNPLGALAQRRITDAAAAVSPHDCLASLASHYPPGDTDLSWTRATPWRSLLAATLDQPHGAISGGRIEAERGNPSADLIASWLSVRLGVPFENRVSGGPGVTAVIFDTSDGEMTLTRPDGRVALLRGPASRSAGWRCTGGTPRSCCPRNCAGWTPTRCTRKPSPRSWPRPGPDEEKRRQQPQAGHRGPGCAAQRGGGAPQRPRAMTTPEVLVHHDAGLLAKAAAARLVTRLVDAQASTGAASLVLTGGGIGTAVLAELAAAPALDAVDWRRLDIWWGDERFLPSGDPERNETQARDALLGQVDADPARVHPMPPSDGPDGNDPEAAAARYAAELRQAAQPQDHGPVPAFDVLMLGIGPEGHVASLFPGMPALYDERPVVAVRGAPKPPPTRITLTLPAIQRAREVWILAAGQEKAGAVRLALSGAGPVQVPAAGARGQQRTLFLLDRSAASQLPPQLNRIASPSLSPGGGWIRHRARSRGHRAVRAVPSGYSGSAGWPAGAA